MELKISFVSMACRMVSHTWQTVFARSDLNENELVCAHKISFKVQSEFKCLVAYTLAPPRDKSALSFS
eukprot:5914800-Pleurochrysis_carterae.AAC.1